MAKLGKKNIVKLDPLAYNIGLLGESGIGKSSIIVEVCEKLVGENGYILFNVGREKGIDAIQGAIYEDVKTWGDYQDFIKEISYNKDEDYKDLKVVVIDTIDELSDVCEKEVIRLHNLKNPQKKVDTINGAFGGFGAGQSMISEMILKSIDDLRDVGVNVIIIGHTKRRTKNDVITGEEYDVITAKITDKLFNDIKTKLDILGMGIIKREIKEDIIGKDIMGKDKIYKNTKSANRVIAFRSEGYALDSKSRFAKIVDEVSFDSDELIQAIKDAIMASFNAKDVGIKIEQAESMQKKQSEEIQKTNIEKIKKEIDFSSKYGTQEELIEDLKKRYTDGTEDFKNLVKAKFKEYGVAKFDALAEFPFDKLISLVESL